MRLLPGKGLLVLAAILGLQQLSAGVPVTPAPEEVQDLLLRRAFIPHNNPKPRPESPGPDTRPNPEPGASSLHPGGTSSSHPGGANSPHAEGSSPLHPGGASSPNEPVYFGIGPGDGFGTVEPIEVYQRKGKDRIDAYEAAILSNRPETRVVDDASQVNVEAKDSFWNIFKNDKYFLFEEDAAKKATSFPELKPFTAAGIGFDPRTMGTMKQITIKPRPQENPAKGGPGPANIPGNTNPANAYSPTDVISRGGYDYDGRYIVAQDGFKGNDLTPPGQQRIPVNEISWQAFASAANGRRRGGPSLTGNLKVIFLMDIQNKGFWRITEQNYKEAGKELKEVVEWTRGDAAATARFERFIGSDNINGKIIALRNHHNAIGNKRVAKVITAPRASGHSQGRFTAALVLE